MSHDLRISARAEKSLVKTKNKFTIQGGSKLEVFDENGKLLHSGEFQSFTANFLKLLYGSMIGAGTAKAKDISNSDVEMNAFPQAWMNLQGGSGVKKFGVVVGTNAAAVSVLDYNITVPAGLTVNDTVVSASSVGVDSISVEISRQISNSSGLTVNLKEAGLICGSEDEVDSNVLIARDLLDITLENSKKSVWRYTVNFNFANDVGGFVKTFADKMFNGIFREIVQITSVPSRGNFGFCVFNGKMWVFGGYPAVNDVWCSENGSTWTQVTSSAAWLPGYISYGGVCVYRQRMLICVNKALWSSIDGDNWSRIVQFHGEIVEHTEQLWLMNESSQVFVIKLLNTEIKVGTSDIPFSANGTALGALIADGSGSGELVYGAMPGVGTVEPFVSGNKTKMSITREFTNNSGADITVREVGLFSGSDMLARLILANPITLANNESEIITIDFETEV